MDHGPTPQPTFLFTDIVGSSRLWQSHHDAMAQALIRHAALTGDTVAAHGGRVVKDTGDGVFAAFDEAGAAVAAAVNLTEAMRRQDWPVPDGLQLRLGVHRGPAEVRGADYHGSEVNRCARLQELAHPGQVLVSAAAAEACRPDPTIALRDLGVHRLRDMVDNLRIYQAERPGVPLSFPPLRSPDCYPNNLPLQQTRFFGRRRELDDLAGALSIQKVVTLTGPGGCGKTRTALEVAARAMDHYPDGVWFVPLGPLTDPALVPTAVASALGVSEARQSAPPVEAIIDVTADKSILIVLDNCEHLVDACARLAAHIVARCSELALLSTSREALGIPGEWVYPLTPLDTSTPPGSAESPSEAYQLFVDRVRLLRREYHPDGEESSAIGEICRRLDGLPLAIELAAARCGAYTARQVAQRLGDRFGLLSRGARTADPRHRTLRATIDWSYDLLSETCRRVLDAASVFAGSFTAEAVECVVKPCLPPRCDVGDSLADLVAASMVVAEDAQGEMRYRLLETIREYAAERAEGAGSLPELLRRHSQYYAHRVSDLSVPHGAILPKSTAAALAADHDNLRAALSWATANEQGTVAAEMAAGLWPYWHMKGHLTEGRTTLQAVLDRMDEAWAPQLRGELLRGAAALAFDQGSRGEAERLWQASLDASEEAHDLRGIASSLGNLGNLAAVEGRRGAARQAYARVLEIMRSLGNDIGVARALANLGSVLRAEGDLETATRLMGEALSVMRAIGDLHGVCHLSRSLGRVAIDRGDHASAASCFEESLSIARDLGDRRSAAMALNNLGVLDLREGRGEAALERFEEAHRLRIEIGDELGAASASLGLCESLVLLGEWSRARGALAEGLDAVVRVDDARLLVSVVETAAQVALATGDEDTARLLLAAALDAREALECPPDPSFDTKGVADRLGPLPDDTSAPSIADAILIARRLAQQGAPPLHGE